MAFSAWTSPLGKKFNGMVTNSIKSFRIFNPINFIFLFKPGELALGIAAGVPFYEPDRLVEPVYARQIRTEFFIADCPQRLRLRREPPRQEPADLGQQPL